MGKNLEARESLGGREEGGAGRISGALERESLND